MPVNNHPVPKMLRKSNTPKNRSILGFIGRTCSQRGIQSYDQAAILVEALNIYNQPANSKGLRSICLDIIIEKSREHPNLSSNYSKANLSSPIQENEILEEIAKICLAFNHLSPELKRLLYFKEILGLSEQNIGTQLNLSTAVVGQGVDVSRQKLRQAFHCVPAE